MSIEDEEVGEEFSRQNWPDCKTEGCTFKACLWAKTGHCHPCSRMLLGGEEMQRRFLRWRAA